MFLRLAVHPEALEEIAEGTGRVPRDPVYRRLQECGVLVAHSKNDFAQLISTVAGTKAQVVAQYFFELAKAGRCVEIEPESGVVPLDELFTAEQVATWRAAIDLLVLSRLRLEDVESEGSPAKPEVCNLNEIMETNAVATVHDLWHSAYPRGASREAIWKRHFKPLAAESSEVVILDRFAAVQLSKAKLLRRKHAQDHRVGAEWFMSKLAESGARKITLVSSSASTAFGPHDLSPGQARNDVESWFRAISSPRTQFRLVLVDAKFLHDRHVFFDPWAGFTLGDGMATFAPDGLHGPHAFHADPKLGSEIRNEFERLSSSSGA